MWSVHRPSFGSAFVPFSSEFKGAGRLHCLLLRSTLSLDYGVFREGLLAGVGSPGAGLWWVFSSGHPSSKELGQELLTKSHQQRAQSMTGLSTPHSLNRVMRGFYLHYTKCHADKHQRNPKKARLGTVPPASATSSHFPLDGQGRSGGTFLMCSRTGDMAWRSRDSTPCLLPSKAHSPAGRLIHTCTIL